MAKYTISLREIAQRDLLPGEDLSKINDTIAVMKRGFFNGVPLDGIKEQYRDPFIAGFAYKFIPGDYEIAMETESLAKMQLIGLMLNNSAHINDIYDNLDKSVFSEYRVHKSTADNTNADNKTDNVTGTATSGGTIKHEDRGTVTHENDVHTIGTDGATDTGNVQNTETGSYKDTNHSQSDGTTSSTSSGTSETTTNGTTSNVNKSNKVNILYDGPQGAIGGQMVEGSNSREGQGVGFVTDNTFNYMSSASEDDSSAHDNGTSAETSEGATSDETSGTTQDITNGYTERTFENYVKGTTDSKTHAGNSETTTDNDTTETYNKDNTEIRNTTDTNTSTTTSTANSTGHSESEDIDYTLNYEMLLKSQSLLENVWALFMDLWLDIY